MDLGDVFVGWTGAEVAISPFAFDDSASSRNTDGARSADFGALLTAPSFTLAVLDRIALAPGRASLGIVLDLADPNEGLFYESAYPQDLDAAIFITVAAAPGQSPESAAQRLGRLPRQI